MDLDCLLKLSISFLLKTITFGGQIHWNVASGQLWNWKCRTIKNWSIWGVPVVNVQIDTNKLFSCSLVVLELVLSSRFGRYNHENQSKKFLLKHKRIEFLLKIHDCVGRSR
jgi:hypothetical protein